MTILQNSHHLDSFFEVNEGIENKILANLLTSNSLKDFRLSLKSKRYTMTKIKRILNNILLGITKDKMDLVKNINEIPYIRPLAFNDKGREILKEIKNNSDITIINKVANVHSDDIIFSTLLNQDIKANDIYNLLYFKNNPKKLKGSMDYYTSPIYIKT